MDLKSAVKDKPKAQCNTLPKIPRQIIRDITLLSYEQLMQLPAELQVSRGKHDSVSRQWIYYNKSCVPGQAVTYKCHSGGSDHSIKYSPVKTMWQARGVLVVNQALPCMREFAYNDEIFVPYMPGQSGSMYLFSKRALLAAVTFIDVSVALHKWLNSGTDGKNGSYISEPEYYINNDYMLMM